MSDIQNRRKCYRSGTFPGVVMFQRSINCVCVYACSENNLQEDLFDQILVGRLDFPSPYWDNITDSAKVMSLSITHAHFLSLSHTHTLFLPPFSHTHTLSLPLSLI